jgi:hypothetical protein
LPQDACLYSLESSLGVSDCMHDDPMTVLCYPATGASVHCGEPLLTPLCKLKSGGDFPWRVDGGVDAGCPNTK